MDSRRSRRWQLGLAFATTQCTAFCAGGVGGIFSYRSCFLRLELLCVGDRLVSRFIGRLIAGRAPGVSLPGALFVSGRFFRPSRRGLFLPRRLYEIRQLVPALAGIATIVKRLGLYVGFIGDLAGRFHWPFAFWLATNKSASFAMRVNSARAVARPLASPFSISTKSVLSISSHVGVRSIVPI